MIVFIQQQAVSTPLANLADPSATRAIKRASLRLLSPTKPHASDCATFGTICEARTRYECIRGTALPKDCVRIHRKTTGVESRAVRTRKELINFAAPWRVYKCTQGRRSQTNTVLTGFYYRFDLVPLGSNSFFHCSFSWTHFQLSIITARKETKQP